MHFEQLLLLQDVLDTQLINDEMSWRDYEREWLSLLNASGYTVKEYELAIDRRWDYIERLRSMAQTVIGTT